MEEHPIVVIPTDIRLLYIYICVMQFMQLKLHINVSQAIVPHNK